MKHCTVQCQECGAGRIDALDADAVAWAMRHVDRTGHLRFAWCFPGAAPHE